MADDTLDPIAQLHDADPAQGAPEPDLDAIRTRAVQQSTVVPMRRRRTAVTVGAVAASVALLAGVALAGVAVGRVSAPSSDVVAAPPAEESLPVVGTASPPIPVVAGQSAANAPMGSPESMSAAAGAPMADKAMIYPGYGTSMLPGPDLTDEPGTAPGYRLDAEGIDLEALARQLGAAFGIPGEPTKQDYGWVVGSVDGTGPAIWIGEDATVSWSFSDPTINPWDCGVTAEPQPAPADGSASTSSGSEPGAPEACKPDVAPISERDAGRQARKILASLGDRSGGRRHRCRVGVGLGRLHDLGDCLAAY
jgi:hypothetical protein